MKRSMALMLVSVLWATTNFALAYSGGVHRGGGRFATAGSHSAGQHHAGQHQGEHGAEGNPPGRRMRISPPHHQHRIVVGGVVYLIGSLLYYYPPGYFPPAYATPIYEEPPSYVEPGPEVRFYCPDYRDYYPNVATCPSPWMQVLPYPGIYPN